MVQLNDDSPALRLADNNARIEVLLDYYEHCRGIAMAIVAKGVAQDLEDENVD